MLIAIKQLESGIKEINSLSIKLKNEIKKNMKVDGEYKETEIYTSIKNAYLKILSSSYELINLYYNEIQEIKNFYNLRNFTKRMFSMITDNVTAESFVEYIRSAMEPLLNSFSEDRHWAHDFSYEWRVNIHNPTLCQKDADTISKIIQVADDRKIKVLDINCGSGENLCNLNDYFKSNKIDTETFAVCYNEFLTYGDEKIDRTIFQGDKRFLISKNVFDVVLTTPQILLDDDDIFKKTNRYEFFNKAISYLRPEGVLIAGIPFYRLSDYFSLLILKNLESVQLVPAEKDLVYIVGKKRTTKLNNKDIHADELEKIKNIILEFEDIRNNEDEKEYACLTLPKGSLEVEKFRGGAITDHEITQVYSSTQTMNDFLNDQEINLTGIKTQRPLLPFTVGQIGLILTSGFLDGIIDEGNGYKHVVKGRVRKFTENDVEIEHGKNKMNVDEVTGNRVEINLFLPDGTFKALA